MIFYLGKSSFLLVCLFLFLWTLEEKEVAQREEKKENKRINKQAKKKISVKNKQK